MNNDKGNMNFPGNSAGKESTCNAGDPGLILGREDPLEKEQATHSGIHGLPWWLRQSSICLQCRRPGFNPWVGKIPWRREQLSTTVFWPGEFHGQRSLAGYRVTFTINWGFLGGTSGKQPAYQQEA